MPTEARFVDVAVGDGFVCGIVRVGQDPVRGLRHASDGCGHRVCGGRSANLYAVGLCVCVDYAFELNVAPPPL
jgi:hypothetical protein